MIADTRMLPQSSGTRLSISHGLTVANCNILSELSIKTAEIMKKTPLTVLTTADLIFNRRFSDRKSPFSGAILHSFCIFDKKLKKKVASKKWPFNVQCAVQAVRPATLCPEIFQIWDIWIYF